MNFKNLANLVIDCHCHLGPFHSFYGKEPNVKNLILEMDRLGIDISVIAPIAGCEGFAVCGNEEMLAAINKYPDRLLGYIAVNPYFPEETRPEAEKYLSNTNVVGFKIHPGMMEYRADEPGYRKMWELAHEAKTIVLAHTWEEKWSTPLQFGSLSKKYPGAKIILGHMGGTTRGIEQSALLAKKYKNIYLDICASQHPVWLEDIVKMAPVEKILFGSDSPFIAPAYVFGRVKYASIPEPDKKKILGNNFLRILGKK